MLVNADWQATGNLWVVFAVTAAVVTDVRWGKIHNVLTVPVLAVGLLINLLAAGGPGLWLSLQGIALGLALLFATLLFGQHMGGGDIKLLMALGALKGPGFLLVTLVAGILLGGVLAVTVALTRGALGRSVRRLGQSLYQRFVLSLPSEAVPADARRFPYAVAIAGGAFTALWWH